MARPADEGMRGRILGAASRLFYERGVRGVGMAEIAERAECGKNGLYRHFPSKAHLVSAYLQGFMDVRDAGVSATLDDHDGDAAAALLELVRQAAAQHDHPKFRGCAVRNYLAEFPHGFDEPTDGADPDALAASWLRRFRRRLTDLARRAGADDPAYVSGALWLVLDGLYAAGGRRGSGGAVSSKVAVRMAEAVLAA